jgi:hypothetical protein
MDQDDGESSSREIKGRVVINYKLYNRVRIPSCVDEKAMSKEGGRRPRSIGSLPAPGCRKASERGTQVVATRAVLSSWRRRRSYYLPVLPRHPCEDQLDRSCSFIAPARGVRTSARKHYSSLHCSLPISFLFLFFMKHLADQLLALPNLLLLVFFSAKADPSDD